MTLHSFELTTLFSNPSFHLLSISMPFRSSARCERVTIAGFGYEAMSGGLDEVYWMMSGGPVDYKAGWGLRKFLLL